jgi:AcrR family transcriptional regulator
LRETSVEEIAREAGVSIGTLYRTFPDGKAEIHTAIQEHRGAELVDHVRRKGMKAFEQSQHVVDAMLEGMTALVDYMVSHPDFLRLTLQQSWISGSDDQTAAQLALREAATGETVEGMRVGIASGAFIDRDPRLLARTLVALQQAHLSHWLENPRPAEEVSADLREMFLRSFCRGEELARRGLK